ncbi:condensation domain-containing protein [Streptomyces sp. TLI_171]|uniref:condensation domain-containing protein n=1 Tax=Streptomyces sp. TLI_171 TaxID=1938859 RepID=UPI000C36225A|nr:condensation domain-containing protein [Streptomyces sp. TLI_171]RKE17799.1 condensation domain-containing protein [Streptomyces sp. TLI_171]
MESLDTRTVTYRGARTGTAPMTWGQRAIWKSIRWLDEGAHYFNIRRTVELPPGRTLGQVDAALTALLERHEALRTTFHESADGWQQHVTGTGTLVYAVLDSTAGDAAGAAARIGEQLVARTFRHTEEIPFRCALVLDDGRPAHLALVFSHLGVDFWAVRELERDLRELLAGTEQPAPDWQPLDQAGYESEGEGAQRGAAAVEHWRRTLEKVPPALFPPVDDRGRPERFVRLGMDSPAAAVAATAIAKRCQVSTGTVLLAATAVVLGAWTGHPTVPLQLIAVNRHDDRSRRLVAAMAENALFSLDVGDGTFDQAVKRAFLSGMNAYRHAHYDPIAVDEVLDAARERNGGVLQLGHFFNDKRMHDRWEDLPDVPATPDGLAPLTEKTRIFHVGDWERQDALFFVHTTYAPDTVLLYLMADTELIPRQDVERVLRAFEALLVAGAAEPVELAAVTFAR